MSAETRLKSGARVGLTLLSLGAGVGAPSVARADSCSFELGFATLHDLIPQEVGNCRDNESHNPDNGDALQHTSGGLLVWRKKDNWTAFTNGNRTWINGPQGLAVRYNDKRFPWEANPEGFAIVDGSGNILQPVHPVEVQMTPEQAINDIDIRYSDPGRQNFIRNLFRDGRAVFDQQYSDQDSDQEFNGYYQKLTGKTPGQVWSQAGTLDQAIAGVDYIGSPDPRINMSRCKLVCNQIFHDRPTKSGSIGTQESFYQGLPNTTPAFTYAFQAFSAIKEARDLAYRRYTNFQGAEALSHYDISVQLNRYIKSDKVMSFPLSGLSLTMQDMVSLRDQYRKFALDLNCC